MVGGVGVVEVVAGAIIFFIASVGTELLVRFLGLVLDAAAVGFSFRLPVTAGVAPGGACIGTICGACIGVGADMGAALGVSSFTSTGVPICGV